MIMTHSRINKTTAIYRSVNAVINTFDLTITERERELVYYFDGKNIVGSRDIAERDGFIETLSHVSECSTCLTNYYVQSVLQYYVNNANNPDLSIHIHESFMLNCSRAHDKDHYLN